MFSMYLMVFLDCVTNQLFSQYFSGCVKALHKDDNSLDSNIKNAFANIIFRLMKKVWRKSLVKEKSMDNENPFEDLEL